MFLLLLLLLSQQRRVWMAIGYIRATSGMSTSIIVNIKSQTDFIVNDIVIFCNIPHFVHFIIGTLYVHYTLPIY